MPSGGYRPGSGRKKKSGAGLEPVPAKQKPVAKRVARPGPGTIPEDIRIAANAHGLTPLDYALKVMNNAEADQVRRDRMCAVALPFCHAKPEAAPQGKKEERQDAAEKAATGKFAPPAPPKLVVNNS